MKVYLLFSFIVFSLQSINAQFAEQYSGNNSIFKTVSADGDNPENIHSRSAGKKKGKEFVKIQYNYKTLLSIGSGYNFNNGNQNNFIFSVDIIPKLSNNFFLDFKIDALKEGLTYNTLLNIIPEYKTDLAENSNFSGYFGIGPTLFFYPKGHPGLDASVTGQVKIEYSLKAYFINAEVRKPVYFNEDSGHIDLILSFNIGIKI